MERTEYEVHFSSSHITIPGLPECWHDNFAASKHVQRDPLENMTTGDRAAHSAETPEPQALSRISADNFVC